MRGIMIKFKFQTKLVFNLGYDSYNSLDRTLVDQKSHGVYYYLADSLIKVCTNPIARQTIGILKSNLLHISIILRNSD